MPTGAKNLNITDYSNTGYRNLYYCNLCYDNPCPCQALLSMKGKIGSDPKGSAKINPPTTIVNLLVFYAGFLPG